LSAIAPYGSSKHGTPWGDALNFDGPHREQVRQFVIDNILFWIDEYHFDGLRLDAVHYMFDDGKPHILDSVQTAFREHQKTLDRTTYLIGALRRDLVRLCDAFDHHGGRFRVAANGSALPDNGFGGGVGACLCVHGARCQTHDSSLTYGAPPASTP